jgi:hypothetical protein
MRSPLWRLELTLAVRRRRLLLLNVGIPLLLVLPVSLGGAPPFHAAAVYAVLFVLFGTFGAAIPVIRDGETGILRRFVLAGASPHSLLLARGLGGATLDALQLLPAVALILVVGFLGGGAATGGEAGAASPSVLLSGAVLLFGALVAANLVGLWVAALARSLAEGALFAAVVALFLLHGSGVFRTSAPGTVGAVLEALLPFGPFHRFLLSGAAGAPPPPGAGFGVLSTLGGAFLLLLVTLVFAPRLVERITDPLR